jgi:hypothetical protein
VETFRLMKSEELAPLKTFRLMKSERWAPLWVDADSKKCQILMVQMTKKIGTLLLLYTLSTQRGYPPLGKISLGQAVCTAMVRFFSYQTLY